MATADSPLGPFTDSGAPLINRADYNNAQQIDPAVFTDDTEESYLYWGNGTAYVAPLNPDLTSIDVGRSRTATATAAKPPSIGCISIPRVRSSR